MATTPRIRIDIGANGVTAILSGRNETRVRVEYAHPPVADGYADALSDAFSELARAFERKAGSRFPAARVRVALLPPIIDARLVQLPPLRPTEAMAILQRDAARYFIGRNGPLAIAVEASTRSRQGKTAAPLFAAAVPAAFIDAIHRAATSVQWRVHSIQPVHAFWIAAAHSHARDAADLAIACVVDGTTHVLRMNGKHVAALRRIPVDSVAELKDALSGCAAAALLGDGARAFRSHPDLAPQLIDIGDDATNGADGLAFVTPTVTEMRAKQRRAWSRRFVAAALAMLVLGATVHWWGLKRELAAIDARRAELRPDVSPLLVWRDSLQQLEDRLALIEQLTARPGRITRALFDVAVLLPPDAHLTAFRSRGDTIMISGMSPRAAEAIQALRSALSFGNVQLDGIIDRELDAGATAQERFNIEAILTPADSTGGARQQIRTVAAGRSGS